MRGRRPLGAIPNRMTEEKWFQIIDWVKEPRSGDMKELRLYGGAFTIIQHWLQFKNEEGTVKRFAKLCPGFDFENAQFYEDRIDRCILCKYFADKSLPRYLQSRPKFDYLHDAFDMDAIKNGSRSDLTGSIQINSYGLQDLQNVIASLRKRKDKSLEQIDDPERGYTVMWKHNPNATDAKLKQGFSEGDHTPIRYHEKKDMFYLPESSNYDAVWGPLTDFLDILTIPEPSELEDDVRRLKLDVEYEAATGVSIFGRSTKKESSNSSSEDWGEEGDAEEEEEEPPKRTSRKETEDEDWGEEEAKEKAPLRRKRQEAASTDDDDWGDDEEDDTPRRKRKSREKPVQEVKEEDDDDWGDDEEVPKQRARRSEESEEKAPRRKRKSREEPAQEAKDDDWGDEEEEAPKRSSRRKKSTEEDDDWGETKSAKKDDDDDWGDDPPPKRRSSNGKKRSKPSEEEESPPDNKRRLSNEEEADEDNWDASPKRKRGSSKSEDPPTRPSRRKGRAPSRSSDWD